MSFGRPATPFAENKYSTRAWDKQMQFVREYLRDPNAARAARRAGFKDAKQEGRRLLQTLWIGDLITRGIDRRWRHARVDPDDVILELKRVGFASIWNYLLLKEDGSVDLDFSALTKESAAGIVRITVEYGQDKTPRKRKRKAKEDNSEPPKRPGRKPVIMPGQQIRKITIQLADKLRALELLGKTKNMFSEPEDETRPSSPQQPSMPSLNDLPSTNEARRNSRRSSSRLDPKKVCLETRHAIEKALCLTQLLWWMPHMTKTFDRHWAKKTSDP